MDQERLREGRDSSLQLLAVVVGLIYTPAPLLQHLFQPLQPQATVAVLAMWPIRDQLFQRVSFNVGGDGLLSSPSHNASLSEHPSVLLVCAM